MGKVNKYNWHIGKELPIIDEHSKVKLDIIERYIEIYLKFLTKGCFTSSLKLNIIDGFSGGGLYKGEITGSPLRIKKVIESTKKIITFEREQSNCPPIKFNIDFRFIEKNIDTFNFLEDILKEYQYYCDKTKCINGTFMNSVDALINEIKVKSRAERSIFILDQYGYADAPLPVVKKIFTELENAEVILTFSVDSLIDYITRSNPTVLINMGLSKEDCEQIFDVKEDNNFSRSKIQPLLYNTIVSVVGAAYYTPFFIRSDVSNRAYWLFHFSSHPTARDEMMKLHWDSQNTFQHFGKAGLQMLIGYETCDTDNLFEFDNFAKEKSLETLKEEVPRLLFNKEPITFGNFKNNIINETPATVDFIKESLSYSMDSNEIEIIGKDNIKRRKHNTIKDNDIIKWNRIKQPKLF
ncbi:MAG: hypothetical protein DRG78_04065 [Epsilonproteobacteria bacterium]|nr:MAG: hypothetical protein DRG78_04065 [Campylobacterota bacterium]